MENPSFIPMGSCWMSENRGIHPFTTEFTKICMLNQAVKTVTPACFCTLFPDKSRGAPKNISAGPSQQARCIRNRTVEERHPQYWGGVFFKPQTTTFLRHRKAGDLTWGSGCLPSNAESHQFLTVSFIEQLYLKNETRVMFLQYPLSSQDNHTQWPNQ